MAARSALPCSSAAFVIDAETMKRGIDAVRACVRAPLLNGLAFFRMDCPCTAGGTYVQHCISIVAGLTRGTTRAQVDHDIVCTCYMIWT